MADTENLSAWLLFCCWGWVISYLMFLRFGLPYIERRIHERERAAFEAMAMQLWIEGEGPPPPSLLLPPKTESDTHARTQEGV